MANINNSVVAKLKKEGKTYEILVNPENALDFKKGKIKYNNLDPNSIDENTIKSNLYLNSDPDLIIRTSECRLSGFLLWQSSYSEIIFLPKILWPELTKQNFISCLEEFSNRQRRFGK